MKPVNTCRFACSYWLHYTILYKLYNIV